LQVSNDEFKDSKLLQRYADKMNGNGISDKVVIMEFGDKPNISGNLKGKYVKWSKGQLLGDTFKLRSPVGGNYNEEMIDALTIMLLNSEASSKDAFKTGKVIVLNPSVTEYLLFRGCPKQPAPNYDFSVAQKFFREDSSFTRADKHDMDCAEVVLGTLNFSTHWMLLVWNRIGKKVYGLCSMNSPDYLRRDFLDMFSRLCCDAVKHCSKGKPPLTLC